MIVSQSAISIRVNDEPLSFAAPVTLQEALRQIGVADRRGVAIAINDTVVPRSQWSARELVEGERVLIIQATQGG